MSILYLAEPGLLLAKSGNKVKLKRKAEVIKEIPIEKIESVVLIGRSHISSPLMTDLLEREIPVTWLSSIGRFFGRLESTKGINIERQREQFRKADDEDFCLALSRSFISGKIKNSRVVLRRYNRNRNLSEVEEIIGSLKNMAQKASNAESTEQLMGYEGTASRLYFKGLSLLVSDNFKFSGRTRQPPTDPFNSMLSFGYTLLMYEVYTVLVNKGLHPYAGFLHKIRRGHPALASDLMEEWRSIIVESTVMNIAQNDFYKLKYFTEPDKRTGGVYLDRTTSKDFIKRFETKVNNSHNYLPYVDYKTSFRESMQFQAGALAKAVENNDPTLYRPVLIR